MVSPSRGLRSPSRTRLLSLLVLSAAACLLAGLLPATAGAAPGSPADQRSAPAHSHPATGFEDAPAGCQPIPQQLPFKPCHATHFAARRPMVVVWGDSHAQQYIDPLTAIARRDRVNLVLIIAGGCPPVIPHPVKPGDNHTECETRQPLALDWIEKAYRRHLGRFKLILGTYYAGYRQVYRQMQQPGPYRGDLDAYHQRLVRLQHYGTAPLFRELGRVGIPTDVVGEDPTVPDHPPACAAGTDPYECPLPRRLALNREVENRRWIRGLMAHLQGTPRLIDITPAACNARTCFAHVDGIGVYWDPKHLNRYFTRTLQSYFEPSFDDVL